MTTQTPPSLEIVTFGCRLNSYESEVMRHEASAAGLLHAVIVNTCAVTAEAERQARQSIRKLKRQDPARQIIVTGCAAQLNPDDFSAMPEVDQVLGNIEKLSRDNYHPKAHGYVCVSDIMGVTETAGHLIEGFDGRTRAFLEIQQGCDHRCTFCIIPFARGPNRSVPVEHVVSEARSLTSGGFRELVLTGVDITAYGEDTRGGPGLGGLVRALLKDVPELARLRLSSLDPVEVDDDLKDIIVEEPRVMPHMHLSLQSGDDIVLKRMKRRHTRDDAIKLCNDLRDRRPEIVYGADLIVGFPTETDTMFSSTLDLVHECGLTYLHVFPYSPRPGTPAARMPQVPMEVRKARSAYLRRKGSEALQTYLARCVGGTELALIERCGEGRTEGYARVELRDSDAVPGEIVPVHISAVYQQRLQGYVAT